MGRYLSNIQLINDKELDLIEIQKKLKKIQEYRGGSGIILYRVDEKNKWISIYDELLESYEFIQGEENPYFSLRMRGIYTMVDDSDELTIVFFNGKKTIGRFFTDGTEVIGEWQDKKNVFPEVNVEEIKKIFEEDYIYAEDKLANIEKMLNINSGALSIGYDNIDNEDNYQVLEGYRPFHHKREFDRILKKELTLFMEEHGFELYRYFDGAGDYYRKTNSAKVRLLLGHKRDLPDLELSVIGEQKYLIPFFQ